MTRPAGSRPVSIRTGIIVVVVALILAVIAVIITLNSDDEDGEGTAASSSSTVAIEKPTSASAASSSAPVEEGDVGGDDGHAPALPAVMQTPEGEVAAAFINGYATYNPNYPSAGEAWRDLWKPYAAQSVIETYDKDAYRLYEFTMQQSVTVQAPMITAAEVTENGVDTVFALSIDRLIVPWYPQNETDYQVQQIAWKVTVTDDSEGMLVTSVDTGQGG